jgi:hypothetical protein
MEEGWVVVWTAELAQIAPVSAGAKERQAFNALRTPPSPALPPSRRKGDLRI